MRSALRLLLVATGSCAYAGLAVLGWGGFLCVLLSPSVRCARSGSVGAVRCCLFRRRKNSAVSPSTASGEERDTDPANRVTINRPQLPAIRVCREICVEQSDYTEDGKDPSVAAGLTHARAKISAGKKRCTRERQLHHYERDQCWVREEWLKPAPPKNGKTDIRATTDGNEQ